jgi:hypothetical protein
MKETSRYTAWLHKRTTAERVAMAYASFGTTELVPHLPKLGAWRPSRLQRNIGIGFAVLIAGAAIGDSIETATKVETAPVVASAPVSKWNNPNVKPFAESPYMAYGEVHWDANTNQWYCQVQRHMSTPCKNTEGRSATQLENDAFKSREYAARAKAEEKAKNEYWCGPFEKPEKTGCHTSF